MKHVIKKTWLKGLALSMALTLGIPSHAGNYTPAPENIRARKEFSDNRFGIFLHWGIYSMYAQGEWYLHSANLKHEYYSQAAAGFFPSKFNAHDWVKAFKDAGAKYICITTRHHDGFSMFDTKYSDYNIMDATPFKRDIIKELADECHKQGIKLHLYYSHLDWMREDYYPLGRTGHNTGRKSHGSWNTYYEFMNNQLTELLTNYGEIGAIWFDGHWDQPQGFDWGLEKQYAMIHKLQPACLIGNNHHITPYEGEDFQMFERDLPGENRAGLSGQEIGQLPLETCETMNGMWGYKVKDQDYKSVKTLVRLLVRAAGKNANLLMNIGPQSNGELPALALDRLKGMGEWMDKYGHTIYGTTGNIITDAEWGTITHKDNKVYVHILTDKMPLFVTIPSEDKVKSAVSLNNGTNVKIEKIKGGYVLHTATLEASTDCIVELTVK